MTLISTIPASKRRYGAALWAGFWGGNIASFVKWGVENILPPRTSDRAIPPAEMLNNLGLQPSQMVYQYSGHVLNWGISGVHHLFSIAFALFYCMIAECIPAIKAGQGIVFAIGVTIIFHGVILPIFHWAPPIWSLPPAELFSETLGHIAWMWTIEVFRRDLRSRITGCKDEQ